MNLRQSSHRNENFPPLKRLEADPTTSISNGGSGSRLLIEDQVALSLTLGCHFKLAADPQVYNIHTPSAWVVNAYIYLITNDIHNS